MNPVERERSLAESKKQFPTISETPAAPMTLDDSLNADSSR
jgi:hypothetical protein